MKAICFPGFGSENQITNFKFLAQLKYALHFKSMIDSVNLLKYKPKPYFGPCPTGSEDSLSEAKKVPLIKTISNFGVQFGT